MHSCCSDSQECYHAVHSACQADWFGWRPLLRRSHPAGPLHTHPPMGNPVMKTVRSSSPVLVSYCVAACAPYGPACGAA